MPPRDPNTDQKRPVFLDLRRIRFPPQAIASIAHRLTGVLMILAILPATWLFAISLSGPAGFARAGEVLTGVPARLAGLLLALALAHHLFAGIRYLLLDIDIGITRVTARRSALLVMVVGVVAGLGLWWGLWA
ncbi:MAG: succinate dehydrogenase, cytochrome b556 subunit [Halothiobacillaceae bacterium]|nr:succinate dehydrogenase, cytochrome b556 subunit [Halothiobacillaceae bacterium]